MTILVFSVITFLLFTDRKTDQVVGDPVFPSHSGVKKEGLKQSVPGMPVHK